MFQFGFIAAEAVYDPGLKRFLMGFQDFDQTAAAVALMENNRQIEFISHFKLPYQPLFLIFFGGEHAVEIETDLSPGLNSGAFGKVAEKIEGIFAAIFGVMGMNADRGIAAGKDSAKETALPERCRVVPTIIAAATPAACIRSITVSISLS